MQCSAQADYHRADGDERERLLKMRHALLDLAEIEDWLQGKPNWPAGFKRAHG